MGESPIESPILITEDHLDRRIDFERGMSVFPRVTVALIAVQAVVFVLEIGAGALDDSAVLIGLGAQESGAARSGEVWRLWSATLLHGSVDHFLGNAIALYVTGMACEHAFGRMQYVVLYFGSALAGSALSLAGLPLGIPAVGASGAIFGLMGAIVSMMHRHRARLYFRAKRIGAVVACWAGYTVLLGFLTPFVDNFAHIGGFAGGAAIGWLLSPVLLNAPGAPRWIGQSLFAVSLAGATAMTIPWLIRMVSAVASS